MKLTQKYSDSDQQYVHHRKRCPVESGVSTLNASANSRVTTLLDGSYEQNLRVVVTILVKTDNATMRYLIL